MAHKDGIVVVMMQKRLVPTLHERDHLVLVARARTKVAPKPTV